MRPGIPGEGGVWARGQDPPEHTKVPGGQGWARWQTPRPSLGQPPLTVQQPARGSTEPSRQRRSAAQPDHQTYDRQSLPQLLPAPGGRRAPDGGVDRESQAEGTECHRTLLHEEGGKSQRQCRAAPGPHPGKLPSVNVASSAPRVGFVGAVNAFGSSSASGPSNTKGNSTPTARAIPTANRRALSEHRDNASRPT